VYLCKMKRSAKITSLLHLVVLYCFIASLWSGSVLTSATDFSSDHPVSEKSYFSFVPSDLVCTSTQHQSFARILHQLPVTSLKNQLNIFLACTKCAELTHVNSCSRYISYATNKITWFRPVDIIFPFHNFW
jgi:hypothetical protein